MGCRDGPKIARDFHDFIAKIAIIIPAGINLISAKTSIIIT